MGEGGKDSLTPGVMTGTLAGGLNSPTRIEVAAAPSTGYGWYVPDPH